MNSTTEQVFNAPVEELAALTATLQQLSTINRYNRWIYDQFAYCLGHRVLEVGSGTGNITQFLLTNDREVVATDVLPAYRAELKSRFSNHINLAVSAFDLDYSAPPDLIASPFDSAVCLNVLEHIKDDLAALKAIRATLKPDGKLALLVPAHQFLYGAFDEAVGHFRRYGKNQLGALLRQAGYSVSSLHYFNVAATLPWFINGRLMRRSYLPNEQVSLADRLVPVLKLEKIFGPPFGISLIAIAQNEAQ